MVSIKTQQAQLNGATTRAPGSVPQRICNPLRANEVPPTIAVVGASYADAGPPFEAPVAEEELHFMPSTKPFRRIKTLRDGNNPTQDFSPAQLLGCETPSGFVSIFDAQLNPVEPFNEFMLDHCYRPGRHKRWQKTQAAYADDLIIWLAFLHRRNVPWTAVGRADVKDLITDISSKTVSLLTRRKLSDATIRRRVGTVLTFYDWAVDEKKLIPIDQSFGYANRRVLYSERSRFAPVFLGKTMKPVSVRAIHADLPTRSDPGDSIRPIPADRMKGLLDALGPKDPTAGVSRRNRLICEAALLTGMRISEVCSLDVTSIVLHAERLSHASQDAMCRVVVHNTKGRRQREVVMPGSVIARLDEYAKGERQDVVEAALQAGKFGGRKRPRPPAELFLNGLSSNTRDLGEAIAPDTAYRAFRAAVVSEGLTMSMFRYEIDPETGAPLRDDKGVPITVEARGIPRHSFHDLRHTYAVNFYAAALAAGRPGALKQLQALLGHKHLSTTANIYLRHVQTGEAIIADLQDALYKRLLGGKY